MMWLRLAASRRSAACFFSLRKRQLHYRLPKILSCSLRAQSMMTCMVLHSSFEYFVQPECSPCQAISVSRRPRSACESGCSGYSSRMPLTDRYYKSNGTWLKTPPTFLSNSKPKHALQSYRFHLHRGHCCVR